MNLLSYAPHIGIACLLIQTAFAVVYFLRFRSQRKRNTRLSTQRDALLVDNTGLRAQNARLIQSLVRLRNISREVENFDPAKEKIV